MGRLLQPVLKMTDGEIIEEKYFYEKKS